MRTHNWSIVVYYFAIVCLLIVTVVVMVKLILEPACSISYPASQSGSPTTVCIDGWSVAGLAAAILGVTGTILALIGALAVAAWWTGLDRRVNNQVKKRVEELFKEKVEQRVGELLVNHAEFQALKANLTGKVDTVTFQELKTQVQNANKNLAKLDRQSRAVDEYLLDTLIIDTPWEHLDELGRVDKARKLILSSGLMEHAPFFASQILYKVFHMEYQIIKDLLSEAQSHPDQAFQKAHDDMQFNIEDRIRSAGELEVYLLSEGLRYADPEDNKMLRPLSDKYHDELVFFDPLTGQLDFKSTLGKEVSSWHSEYEKWRHWNMAARTIKEEGNQP